MSIRVSNQIFNPCTRALPKIFDASGHLILDGNPSNNAIGTDPPTSYGTGSQIDNSGNVLLSMGRAGDDHSVGIVADTIADFILWVWEPNVGSYMTAIGRNQGRWVKGGAVATEYKKTPDTTYGKFGFWVPKSQHFYIQASVVVANAWIGAQAPDVAYGY